MRSARRVFFSLLLAILMILPGDGRGTNATAATSRIEARRGDVSVRTARGQARLDSGAIIHVDRVGRIHRPTSEERAPADGRRTILLVTEGAVMARPLGPVEAGLEATVDARRQERRRIDQDALRRLDLFMKRLPRPLGLSARDRAEITRITWSALDRIEALDADRLFDEVTIDGRFADRPFSWYGDLLREIAPRIARCRAALVLMEPKATGADRATSRFVVSFELSPKLVPVERITLSGSGEIEYARPFGAWRISGGRIRAFVVDSKLLPSEFVRLRELALTET